MDPNNQTDTNPQSADAPVTAPQGTVGDSSQDGRAQATAPEPPKWVHQLAGDLKGHEQVLRHQNPNDLVRDYLKYAERADRLVELPGDDADEQARAAFLDKMRPASPDDYPLERPELPEGMEYNADFEAAFRSKLHELGMTPQQASELYNFQMQDAINDHVAEQKAQAEAIHALKKEWGDNFDGNVAEVQTAFKTIAGKLGDPELAQRMVESGYGNDPDMLKTFHGIWQMIKPDTLVSGSTEGGVDDATAWYPDTNFGDY